MEAHPYCSELNETSATSASTTGKESPPDTSRFPDVNAGVVDEDGHRSFADASPSIKRRKFNAHHRHDQNRPMAACVIIRILSATYGPSESLVAKSCMHPESNDGTSTAGEESARIPLTRDCAPFLRALLVEARDREEVECNERQNLKEQTQGIVSDGTAKSCPLNPADRTMPRTSRPHAERPKTDSDGIRLRSTVDGQSRTFVFLLGGGGRRSMNASFGDPSPGTSKQLRVHYMVTEISTHDGNDLASRAARTQIYRANFAEHERVVLRRRLSTVPRGNEKVRLTSIVARNTASASLECGPRWSMNPATSEVVLPILLPFLEIRERVQCRVVCSCWKTLVRQWGVATTIDVNDRSMVTNSRPTFSRPVLRGILAHSYSSLQRLFLGGFNALQQGDLHPALPQMQNLNTLDVSRCNALDNTTLKLLTTDPIRHTLRVLYLKGLYRVTDAGLRDVCESCTHLEVLDISHIDNITDRGAQEIQQLNCLRALFLRENYLLTNESLDVITQRCMKLAQLTLWGCIRVKHLKFDVFTSERLTILNLWGCYSLGDDTALIIGNMPNLSSLIVSECHRLTDGFVQTLVAFPCIQQGLQHLHLRYLKRITDASIVAIGQNLHQGLYSLDLSFCSRLTAMGIYQLLDSCRHCLAELRLTSCSNLQIGRQEEDDEFHDRATSGARRHGNGRDHAGYWILNALQRPYGATLLSSQYNHALCMLDVRGCGGQPVPDGAYPDKDPFVVGMVALQFEQKIPGLFARPAKHCIRTFRSQSC